MPKKINKSIIYGTNESLLIKTGIIEHEQRKDPRRVARWRVNGQDKSANKFTGVTENISQSGLLLTIYDGNGKCFLGKGDKIHVEINMVYKSIQRTIEGIVLIRHSVFTKEGKKLGVEFIKIQELERKLLNTFAVNKI